MINNSKKPLNSMNSKVVPKKIAEIFLRLYSKINLEQVNNTSTQLSIDILNENDKKILLKQVLIELEVIVLNLFSSEIPVKKLLSRNQQIFGTLIFNILDKVLLDEEKSLTFYYDHIIKKYSLVDYTIEECCVNWELFLNLIYTKDEPYSRKTIYNTTNRTKDDLLEALIDTLVIRISHCVGYILIDFKAKKRVDERYSLRELNNIRNTLSREFYIEKHLLKPKALYENKHLLWVISTQGIFCRYIYIISENQKNYKVQTANIIIELVDFISPMVFSLLNLIRKTILFVFSKVIVEILIVIKYGIRNFMNLI